ncbi:hypothetical protein ACFSTE_13580 [Aquimarina hainanensis]|uniref:Lipoprotein n=1 Tax=Aquimarina hainanensis TaxID=1578017 RepID=A0ABW5N8B9_9FLAO|nr:hypothetical protein [Aquimarina sp. TRL1]QKX04082.1 hypothetical protein HN014_03885 [Aquimarina sp. TRL1]
MNGLKKIGLVGMAITLLACGGSSSRQEANAAGFEVIEKEIKSKFGDEVYFTDLMISYNKSIGNIIGVTVTKAPESLKMGQWNLMRGSWTQNSEISLEVPEGTRAADFMFQLNEKISLSKLGELAEQARKKLEEEKNIEKPAFKMAYIKFPKNGDIAKTEYVTVFTPENGGTNFTFSYKLNGDFIEMNY